MGVRKRATGKTTDEEFRDLMIQLVREGWTQTEIADELGVHPSTVNSWINREVTPPAYRAPYIADCFGFQEERVEEALNGTTG